MKKKHIIGMKMSEKDERHIGGLIFVACMFIGAGIGLAFHRPDVGGAIGMGIGFLLMAFLRNKKITPITISLPKSMIQIALLVIGILIIFSGLCLLYNPALLYPYLAGIGVVIIGILILLSAIIGYKKEK
jgi:hypothetical protein